MSSTDSSGQLVRAIVTAMVDARADGNTEDIPAGVESALWDLTLNAQSDKYELVRVLVDLTSMVAWAFGIAAGEAGEDPRTYWGRHARGLTLADAEGES